MSEPRQVLPGRVVLITRRCAERRFFLRPDAATNQAYEYVLAEACNRLGLRLVAVCAMSNHHHVLAYDEHGRHPELTRQVHGLLARVLNRKLGRTGSLWDGEQVSVVEVADAGAVVDAAAYVLANPTAAGLVEHGRDWPGVRSSPQSFVSAPRVIKRPEGFFEEAGPMPHEVELRFSVPPTHAHLGPVQFAKLLGDRVAALEAQHRADRAARGEGFLGPRAVAKQRFDTRPKVKERRGPKRVLHPLVMGSNASSRKVVLARIADFRVAYAKALLAFAAGNRAVTFPAGAWLFPKTLRLSCHSPP